MTRASPTRDALIELLRYYDDGMTAAEIAQETGRNHSTVLGVIHNWRKKTGSEIFRVIGWEPCRGKGGLHQPIFALGPGPDVPLKKLPSKEGRLETQRRYRQNRRVLISARQSAQRYGLAPNPWRGLL